MSKTNAEVLTKLYEYLVEINSDRCTITHEMILAEEDPNFAEILAGLLCLYEDLKFREAERQRLQEQLIMVDRLASVGTLAAGVAHEINNPLTFILGKLSLAQNLAAGLAARYPAETSLQELTSLIADPYEGALRIQRIVQDLRHFYQPTTTTLFDVDVQQALEQSLAITQAEIVHRARLIKDFRPSPAARADKARLIQVFINLLLNAAQAIPEGRAEEHFIAVTLQEDPFGRVCIEVRDSGIGMTPEVQKHIFDPFFTTRTVSGTGLGLSVCHGIISSLGGEINVESMPGKGSTIRVLLPKVQPATGISRNDAAPQVPPTPQITSSARILVVEDEPDIVELITLMLAHAGFAVDLHFASDGRAAHDIVAAGARFDLILSDVSLPKITGIELYKEFSRIAPEQAEHFIFMTGGAFTANAQQFLATTMVPILSKPFTSRELLTIVAQYVRRPAVAP